MKFYKLSASQILHVMVYKLKYCADTESIVSVKERWKKGFPQ